MAASKEVLKEALNLTPTEKAELIDRLLSSRDKPASRTKDTKDTKDRGTFFTSEVIFEVGRQKRPAVLEDLELIINSYNATKVACPAKEESMLQAHCTM